MRIVTDKQGCKDIQLTDDEEKMLHQFFTMFFEVNAAEMKEGKQLNARGDRNPDTIECLASRIFLQDKNTVFNLSPKFTPKK